MDGQVKIDSLFAFIAIDTDGTEGIVSIMLGNGQHFPLIGGDMARVAVMRPVAQRVATESGVPVQLVHFSNRDEKEVILP